MKYKITTYQRGTPLDSWGWEITGNGLYICKDGDRAYTSEKGARDAAKRASKTLRLPDVEARHE
jgi:hypothetical protein